MIHVLIAARSKNSRFPAKLLQPFPDDKCNVLQHCIRRLRHFSFIPHVITPAGDWPIRAAAELVGCPFYEGDHNLDALTRQALDHWNLHGCHRLGADDPLFDPLDIHRSLAFLKDSVGWVDPSRMNEACALGLHGTSLRAGTTYQTRVTLPDGPRRIIWRATLDYLEDHWLLSTVLRSCGALAPRNIYDQFIDGHTDLMLVNDFRQRDWAAYRRDQQRNGEAHVPLPS